MALLLRVLKLAFLFILFGEIAHAQKFQWANRAGGTGLDESNGLCVDAAGNSYIIGTFTDTATFGNFTLMPTLLLNAFSTQAIFIAKYNALGQLVWAKKSSNSNLDFGKDIAVDASGNIYVTGGFSGTVNFGTATLVSNGFGDMYLAKYDRDGNFMWAKKGGGASFTVANSLALDSIGNSYVTGYFRASAVFGDYTLTSVGRDDVFIVKYNREGNVVWAKNAGGIGGSAVGSDVAVAPDGACYVTGFFYGPIAFDTYTLPGSNNQDVRIDLFLTRYDALGQVEWTKQVLNPLEDYPGGIITDKEGNCFMTGSFTGTAALGTYSLTSKGSQDIFVAKYDPVGKVIWAKNAGGSGNDAGKDIVLFKDSSIYIAGNFTDKATFQDTTLISKGAFDLFITKWDTSGREIYTVSAGGFSQDNVNKISLDTTGNAHITGNFEDAASFDAIALTSRGELDIFVAKFGFPFSAPPSITVDSIENFNYCAGPVVYVPFRASGIFNPDNTFVAQLSDAAGSFATPIAVGVGTASPIKAIIPNSTPPGNGYKIRIIATSPTVNSTSSENALEITTIGLGSPIPNIITPNGDGLNDTFKLTISCFTVDLRVYNRWGKLIYEQANYQNTWNGANLPAGIYYYQVLGSAGNSWKGWVEIIH